jgi:hypothetical protein
MLGLFRPKIRFLQCPEISLLIVRFMHGLDGGLAIKSLHAYHDQHPATFDFGLIVDLRNFQGVLASEDLMQSVMFIRGRRLALGLPEAASRPQILLCSNRDNADMLILGANLVMVHSQNFAVTDMEEAWAIAAPGKALPTKVRSFLSRR